VVHVRGLHKKYGSLVQFLLVYISESPHELPAELRSFAEPSGSPPGSRLRLLPRVRAGRELLDLRFPCLIDNEKCEAEILYNAYPTRLIIVDSAGHIALESSFHPWEEITDWLDRYAASYSPHPAEPG
jgi:hypothetical protein